MTDYGHAKQNKASQSDEWTTPKWLVDAIQEVYGPIVLDAAASADNAVGPHWYTKEDDALTKSWVHPYEGIVFCNPPYSRGNKAKFIAKARETAKAGRTVVCVIPASMGDKWFHELVLPPSGSLHFTEALGGCWAIHGRDHADGLSVCLMFLNGRVSFASPLNPDGNGSPGGTVVVAFLGASLASKGGGS